MLNETETATSTNYVLVACHECGDTPELDPDGKFVQDVEAGAIYCDFCLRKGTKPSLD